MSKPNTESATGPAKVSPSELARLLEWQFTCPIEQYTPLMITGIPGLGKTTVTGQVADKLGKELHVLRMIQHESIELTGLPCTGESVASWQPFGELLPTDPDWDGMIFLDEITQLEQSDQKVIAGMVDREGVAGRRIPKNARFVLAGNRTQDRAGAQRLISIIESRCLQVELVFDMNDWQKWAIDHDVDITVRSFANFVGGEFVSFDPNKTLNPLPRPWEKLSNNIKSLASAPEHFIQIASRGLVGDITAKFMSFRKHYNVLHGAVDKVLKGKKVSDELSELSAQHALVGGLVQRISDLDKSNKLKDDELTNAIEFSEKKLHKPVTAILILQVMHAIPARLSPLPAFIQWANNNSELIHAWRG